MDQEKNNKIIPADTEASSIPSVVKRYAWTESANNALSEGASLVAYFLPVASIKPTLLLIIDCKTLIIRLN